MDLGILAAPRARYDEYAAAVRELAEGRSVNYVLLAWTLTVIIRLAQGSATVAMIAL